MALLMGDSIFKRLVALHPSLFNPHSASLCVGGYGVQELKVLTKLSEFPFNAQVVVLLVGINDIIKSRCLSRTWSIYVSFVRFLLRKGLVVFCCQLLPVANSTLSTRHQKSIDKFNFWISTLAQKPNVRVVSFSALFYDAVSKSYFKDKYCPRINNRPDYLHPNKKGLSEMCDYLISVMGV
jgi:lysophospholipase L1-like esterase